MLFTFVFAGAVIDALVNGPKLLGWRLYAVAALALGAVLAQEAIGFILTEVVIVGFFLEAAALERKALQEAAEALKASAVSVGKPQDDNDLPQPVRKLLLQATDAFRKNLSEEKLNAYGGEWKLVQSEDGVQVYQSDFPKQKCKFWKVEAQVRGDYETLKRDLVDYDLRCKWDTGLKQGRILKSFNNIPEMGDPTLDIVYTHPAAGGLVKSREIVDVGLMCDKDRGFEYINCTLPAGITMKELPTKVVGERAFTHIGSGMSVKPVADAPDKNVFKYTLITALDLGGWLPASVVNQATSGALLDSTKALINHMASKPK